MSLPNPDSSNPPKPPLAFVTIVLKSGYAGSVILPNQTEAQAVSKALVSADDRYTPYSFAAVRRDFEDGEPTKYSVCYVTVKPVDVAMVEVDMVDA